MGGCTSGYRTEKHYVASVQTAIDTAQKALEDFQAHALELKDASHDKGHVDTFAHMIELQAQQEPSFQSLKPHEQMHRMYEVLREKVKAFKTKAKETEKAVKAAARSVKKASHEAGKEQRRAGQPEHVYQETSQSGEYRGERLEDWAEDVKDATDNYIENFERSTKHALKEDTKHAAVQETPQQPGAVVLSARTTELADEVKGVDMSLILACMAGFAVGVVLVSGVALYHGASTKLNQ